MLVLLAFSCSTSPSAVVGPTRTPCPSLPTKGVESHKNFCGERSAPHYAAQGEYSRSIAHYVRTFYLGLPHFTCTAITTRGTEKLMACTLFETLLPTLSGVRTKKSGAVQSTKFKPCSQDPWTFIQMLWKNPKHLKEQKNYAVILHLRTK